MKKYRYTALALITLALSSCGGNKKEGAANAVNTDTLSRPQNVKIVAAIARVEPAGGFIDLSANVSGIVTEMYKREGDRVKKSEPILKLDKENETLQVSSARQDIITQQSRISANKADIQQYEAALKEKEEDLAITKKLAETGADTRQNVAVKEKERDVLIANLQSAREQLKTAQSELNTLRTRLAQSELSAKERLVTAKEEGVLVELNAKTGTAITAFQPFAKLAETDSLILHGEIDEMFASRVQIGQQVEVNNVGNSAVIAAGKLIYLSPILENKSLFYEKTGETSDRRVRRFKASVDSPEPLLINGKVECKIKLQ